MERRSLSYCVQPACFDPAVFPDYALLDSGAGEKLERFGDVLLVRPDPQALWRRRLDAREWQAADLVFVRESDRGGRWEPDEERPRKGWVIGFQDARFLIRPTPFKHVGLFPEQAANWLWMKELLPDLGEEPRILNLFGYTGAASVLARQWGCDVTHVDASRTALAWARENAELSGLAGDALRLVLEDALAFVRRDARRGARYQGIWVDPPHYGRGPKGEKWQFETGLAPLLEACERLLAERSFLVLSSYAIGYSALSLANLLRDLVSGSSGNGTAVDAGELVLPEAGENARILPCGFCARWRRGLP